MVSVQGHRDCELAPAEQGMWAVFELDESIYWGGHVVIVDTDAWTWHGTGIHWDWPQHAYKW